MSQGLLAAVVTKAACIEGGTLLPFAELPQSWASDGPKSLKATPKHKFFTFTLNPRKNQTMKSSITSNRRPLLCAFYASLIATAALWAMPRNACAQLLDPSAPVPVGTPPSN